jgi:hypothetical protein
MCENKDCGCPCQGCPEDIKEEACSNDCDNCSVEVGVGSCEDGCKPDAAFGMFQSEQSSNDEIGHAIIASIEKIAKGVLTLQQEIALLAERVESHEAHLNFLLLQNPQFCQFLKDKETEIKAAVQASPMETKPE